MADLQFTPSELRPLIQSVVAEMLRELEQRRQLINGRVALSEAEAAELLGLNPWQLRDLRLNGKIGHTRIVGGRIRYTLEDLMEYLGKNHEAPTS